jgi:hypothetical protein
MRGENDKEAKTNGIIQNIEGYKKYRRKGADIRIEKIIPSSLRIRMTKEKGRIHSRTRSFISKPSK